MSHTKFVISGLLKDLDNHELTNFTMNSLCLSFFTCGLRLMPFSKFETYSELNIYPKILLLYYYFLVHAGFSVTILLLALRNFAITEIKGTEPRQNS